MNPVDAKDPWAIMETIAEKGKKKEELTLFEKSDESEEFKIELQSLTGRDETDAHVHCFTKGLRGLAYIYEVKIQLLARVIISVNGSLIERDKEDSAKDTIIVQKMASVVGKWNQSLIDRVFIHYAVLVGDVEKQLNNLKLGALGNEAMTELYEERQEGAPTVLAPDFVEKDGGKVKEE